jgi:hypothetical protein
MEVDDFDKTIEHFRRHNVQFALELSTCLDAGRRLSWVPATTNSAFINERPNEAMPLTAYQCFLLAQEPAECHADVSRHPRHAR